MENQTDKIIERSDVVPIVSGSYFWGRRQTYRGQFRETRPIWHLMELKEKDDRRNMHIYVGQYGSVCRAAWGTEHIESRKEIGDTPKRIEACQDCWRIAKKNNCR